MTLKLDLYSCPRCFGGIPNSDERGKYPGAISRTDNLTEICSECGVLEAVEQFSTGSPVPQQEWLAYLLNGNQ